MVRTLALLLSCGIFLLFVTQGRAQQLYRMPDLKILKHLTSKQVDKAPDVPGAETLMDYYTDSASGNMLTVYSYNGRPYAFSTYSNSDMQKTYRVFFDTVGNGLFQEVQRNAPWQIPPWAR